MAGMTELFALLTERLILRGWEQRDLAPMLAMCNDPQVMRFLGPHPDESEMQAVFARQTGFQRDLGYCFWIMERRADGAMLGFCGLKPGHVGTPIEGKVEIGWRMRADAWGQGYAREAAQASLGWAWANLPDPAIWAITSPGNVRSWGLMERLGMTRHHDLDFDFHIVPEGDPLRPHITYSIGRPT